MKEVQAWVEAHFSAIREDWFTFLRFKTVSSDPTSGPAFDKCTAWLKRYLEAIHFKTEIIQTPGRPLVYGEDLSAGKSASTLLLYGHYDVMPTDPIEEWKTDPFEPIEKGGLVYARGAQDDKGQIFYTLAALKAMRELGRKLPVNVKLCIEGEEEFGSRGLAEKLPALKEKFQADSLLVVDFGLAEAHTPSINLGARGLVTMDVTLRGSKSDLHSGSFGGIAYNPNRALAELLAQCWDEKGRVQVPHFYDDAVPFSASEVKQMSCESEESVVKEAGIGALGNEEGMSLAAANCWRPTFEINGLCGGYFGPGFKTVIPAQAIAKISCRLVPNQDPSKIGKLVKDYLQKKVKKGIQIQVDVHPGGSAYRGRPDSKLAKAVAKAYEEMFGKPCKGSLSGGSIPVIAEMLKSLQADIVGMGYGLPTDNIHAPNEHFGVDRFKKGLVTVVQLFEHLRGT